jgi:hypothetical protein
MFIPRLTFYSTADIYGFFFHAVSDEEVAVTLEELHSLVRDIWLTRHDSDLEAERLARRKGRPKSVKESQLEEIKLRETEEYRTGLGRSCSPGLLSNSSFVHPVCRSSRSNSSSKCSTIQTVGPERTCFYPATPFHPDIPGRPKSRRSHSSGETLLPS